jgi:hypothetical protein
MHHEQHCLPHGTNPVPPLLTIHHAVFAQYQVWVGKYARCDFKIDASVLFRVSPILCGHPIRIAHRYT